MVDGSAVNNATLRALLARTGALNPVRSVAVITQIAAVVDAADAVHAVRRDVVDPTNIVLTADDNAFLLDAGDSAGDDAGTAIDALGYLAPERLVRNAPVSAATDVYALACVLFECLTGAPPYPVSDDLSAFFPRSTAAI